MKNRTLSRVLASTLIPVSGLALSSPIVGCADNKAKSVNATTPAEQKYPLIFVQASINEIDQPVPFGKSLGIDASRDTALELCHEGDGFRITALGSRPASNAATNGWARLIRKEEIASLFSGAQKHAAITHIASPAILTSPGQRGEVRIDDTDKAENKVGLSVRVTGNVRPTATVISMSMDDGGGAEIVSVNNLEVPDGMAIAAMLPARGSGPRRLLTIIPAAVRSPDDYPFQTASGLQ